MYKRQLLAGILHLGDVEFLTGSGGGAVEEVSVVSEETLTQLQRAATLFGLDPQELLLNMVHQNMYVNGSVIVKQQTIIQVSPLSLMQQLQIKDVASYDNSYL